MYGPCNIGRSPEAQVESQPSRIGLQRGLLGVGKSRQTRGDMFMIYDEPESPDRAGARLRYMISRNRPKRGVLKKGNTKPRVVLR